MQTRHVPSDFQLLSAIKFKVISRFYPGQKRLFSRFSCRQKADAKGILKSQEHKTWKKSSQYNIEILNIVIFQVYPCFLLHFKFCPDFLTF